ncbi:MAG: shikimate dehydrogenase [Acidimicrobiales bacterium]
MTGASRAGRPLGATTTLAAVIGSPVRHSRSPALMNAAFAAGGLDWAFAAFEVPGGQAGAAVAAMRTLGLGGLSVTMPHKADVLAAVDRASATAQALGAVNCVAWEEDELVGHNTDGAGLVASLHTDHAIEPTGMRTAVIGAGGAARSVVLALASAGVAEVVVVNRTASRADTAASLAGPVGRVGSHEDISAADLVVNATSVGMGAPRGASGPLPVPSTVLRRHQAVVDLVYDPLRTPLLDAAEAVGARALDGLGMLVHQAAIAVALWTGTLPDLDAMAAAARAR